MLLSKWGRRVSNGSIQYGGPDTKMQPWDEDGYCEEASNEWVYGSGSVSVKIQMKIHWHHHIPFFPPQERYHTISFTVVI